MCGQQLVQLPFTQQHALCESAVFFASGTAEQMQPCTACLPAALMLVCIPGDPVEAVLLALEAAERVFGVDMNSRGYKVPKGCGVIQGDGISIEMLDNILQAVMARGYSAQVLLLSDMLWELSLPFDQTS